MVELELVVDIVSGLLGNGRPSIITQQHFDSWVEELERLELDEEFQYESKEGE